MVLNDRRTCARRAQTSGLFGGRVTLGIPDKEAHAGTFFFFFFSALGFGQLRRLRRPGIALHWQVQYHSRRGKESRTTWTPNEEAR